MVIKPIKANMEHSSALSGNIFPASLGKVMAKLTSSTSINGYKRDQLPK